MANITVRKRNEKFSPEKTGWVILIDGTRVYLHIIWKTKEEAFYWLEDMLKPYPFDNEWRKRVKIAYWPIARKNNITEFRSKPLEQICQDPEEKILSQSKIAPYGYKKLLGKNLNRQFVEDPEEQKVIRQVFNYYFVDRINIDKISDKLVSSNIRNRNYRPFAKTQIIKILDRFIAEDNKTIQEAV